jgi:SAM-dependent methyltransferase
LRALNYQSEFDRTNGVNTDGEFGGWTYLSDLDIKSPNWVEGNNYLAIEPERFNRVLASMDIAFEGYTFIDFGSGKGRALLLASEFPFKRIIGLEFSPELHRIAERNIGVYHSTNQQCMNIQSLNLDFAQFPLPPEPLVLLFFDPCRKRVLQQVIARIGEWLPTNPYPLYLAYVAPRPEQERLFLSSGFLKESFRSSDLNFLIYQRIVGTPERN